MDYLKDGAEIYRRSFATIRAEADLSRVPSDLDKLAVRVAHACGMIDVIEDLAFSPDAGGAGRRALQDGASILTDSSMVADGVTRSRLPAANAVRCTLRESATIDRAAATGTTRSAAAVDGWLPWLEGSVVAIGNAPTALFRLLDLLSDGAPRPALVIGMPVGYVGAVESKQALAAGDHGVEWVCVHGRRGGSAMAAAAVNALASDRE